MQRSLVLLATLSALAWSLGASTIISGNFDIDGSVIVTDCSAVSASVGAAAGCTGVAGQQTISWLSNGGTADQATIEQNADLTGSFTGLGNTNVGIQNLLSNTEPTGGTFGPNVFITFLAAPTYPMLDITTIAAQGAGTDCGTATPAVGQTCGPPGPNGMATFFFTNTAGINSNAVFSVSGVSSDGNETWKATFTVPFLEPYQSVLSTFATAGQVSNSYGNQTVVTLAITSVPEPEVWTCMGLGLVLLVASRLRLPRKLSQSR